MSNSNVFEQYQKYFDSLITRHKEACKLENQNAHQIPSVPQQQQQQQQPLQQSQPQQQQQPLQQSQPQQQQQQQTPIAIRRQQMPPTTHQPEIDMYGSRRRQQPPPQRYDDYDQELDYGYYGRGGRAMMDQPWPRRQPMRPPPPPPPSQYHPDDYCRYYYNNRYRDYPAEPMTLQSQSPPPPPPPTTSAFRPDGRVDPSPEDVEKKKPTFCYPNGVSGYQGGGPCGPCTSCNAKSPTDDSGSDNPVTLQQKLQQRQKQVSDRPQQQQQQEQQSPQRQQQKPCEGQNCADVWPSASSAAAAGAAVAAAAAKSDAPQERLPLGVTEPFVVGPTSYQYFFDSNLA